MKKLIQEPMLHFLLLGALIFGFYAVLDRDADVAKDDIIVSAGQVESLAANFAKLWQRPPSVEELKGLVDQYVKEEILSREAVKLGLDQNDIVIRRRLQQKMEFVAEGLVAVSRPTQDELEAYLESHSDTFEREPRFSFRQVFLDPGKRGQALASAVTELRRQLGAADGAGDIGDLGDRLMLPAVFDEAPASEVANTFGAAFAKKLAGIPPGEWAGPIESGYGVHLVNVDAVIAARVPELEEVRAEVERNLMAERRADANGALLDALLAKYNVRIVWPQADTQVDVTSSGDVR